MYLTISILAGAAYLLYLYPPDEIVAHIGVDNTYLAAFLIAASGGLSSFTSGVFYAAVATFSSGGANPWLLGLIGGTGIAIGDSIIFGLCKYGLKDVTAVWKERISSFGSYLESYPSWLVYGILFLILGFSPMPNDIVMFALATLGFRYLQIAPLLLAAGITITTVTAVLGRSVTAILFG